MEQDEKFENQLNLALDLSEEEREKSKDLDAGYDKETDQWEIIFRYAGTLDTIRWSDTTRIEPLSMGYAIAYIKEDELEAFGANEQVIYIEKPKNLLLSRQPSIAASCMLSVKNPPLSLTGRGVFVAVIDTGIDIFTRILWMKMEILRFMHYGIKRSKEVRQNHFLTEISIRKKKSIKYCTQKVEDTIFKAGIDLGMEHR